MNRRKLMQRIMAGTHHNIAFTDFLNLIAGFGFQVTRIRGSHHICSNPMAGATISIQPVHGQAKPYQVREFLKMVRRYNLIPEDES